MTIRTNVSVSLLRLARCSVAFRKMTAATSFYHAERNAKPTPVGGKLMRPLVTNPMISWFYLTN